MLRKFPNFQTFEKPSNTQKFKNYVILKRLNYVISQLISVILYERGYGCLSPFSPLSPVCVPSFSLSFSPSSPSHFFPFSSPFLPLLPSSPSCTPVLYRKVWWRCKKLSSASMNCRWTVTRAVKTVQSVRNQKQRSGRPLSLERWFFQ